ncbi:MAG: patatin family protein [Ruminococcus sp.]|nr:patatin family protein [Ruminococcus sp.]
MKKKSLPDLKSLPRGNAPKELLEGALVLEGGAFRGVYTNGVLDVLMREGICLRTTYGVSAGALNGINYVAGQIGRSARINLRYRRDSRYVGKDAFRTNKGIIGFDFIFGDLPGVEKLNESRLMSSETEFFPVACCMETGEAVPIGKNGSVQDLFKAVQASASLPYFSSSVVIDGEHYLDGGAACRVPFPFPLERGFDKIVVIRTRQRAYRKQLKTGRSLSMNKLVYKKYPLYLEALSREKDRYNRDCDTLELLEKQGKIFVIAPSEQVTVKRLEGDMDKLTDLYWLGVRDAEERMAALKEYFGL